MGYNPVRAYSQSFGSAVPVILLLFLVTSAQLNQGLQQQQQQQKQQLQQEQVLSQLPLNKEQPSQQQQQPKSQLVDKSIYNLKSLLNRTGLTTASPFNDRKCLLCKFSVSLVNYALKTSRGRDQVDKLANSFCHITHLESPLVCSQVTKLFNHEITKVLTYGIVTPNQVCGLLSNNTCGHFHSPLDDWEVQLETSSHLIDKVAEKQQQAANSLEQDLRVAKQAELVDQKPYRVIHISDTHVDLNYEPGSLVDCDEPLCCQKNSSPPNKTVKPLNHLFSSTDNQTQSGVDLRAGFWGSYGHCDIPMRTLEAALKFVGSLVSQAKDIDYIIWTGDIQPHDVWAQNKKAANRVFDSVFAMIFKYLPNIKILPTLGNHEMIPVDSFSPSNLLSIAKDDSPVWLYKKLDSFWSRWLPADTIKTIIKDGFYATTVKKGLKVVSLNTNFCHAKNFWLFINSTDPGSQLQWLVHELQMSELLNEKVHIIGHIPPGSDDCLKVWSKNYNRILRRYTNTVTGQFFGHTHNNEFEMFYAPRDQFKSTITYEREESSLRMKYQAISTLSSLSSSLSNNGNNLTGAIIQTAAAESRSDSAGSQASLVPIKVGFIGPSVTTFIGLNPSFRIYSIDPKRDFMPTDFETYYMNLTQANANETRHPTWTSAGLFTKIFNLNDTSPESMHDLLIEIAADLNLDSDTNEDSDDENSVESSPTTTQKPSAEGDQATSGDDDEDDEPDDDDRLYELYRLFNSYSDVFDRATYGQITIDDKKKFLCRLLTGESHNFNACTEFSSIMLPLHAT